MKILSNFSYVRRIIVTIILLFQYNIYPQNFSSEVDTVNVKIGEKISYSINYELDSLIEIPLPKDIDFLPLELIEEFDLDTVLIDEKYFFKKKYSLLKFDPGTYFIPSFKFDLKGKIFKVDSIKVNINPVIVDTTKQKLYDLKPMIENTSFWIRMLAKYNLDYLNNAEYMNLNNDGNAVGNNFGNKSNDMPDGMIEHVFERIYINVIDHLNLKYKIV